MERERKFVYDGWSLIAEYDGNNGLVSAYVRGEGGLPLALWDGTECQIPIYAGNRNIKAYMRASDGVEEASYEHDPFGKLRTLTEGKGSVKTGDQEKIINRKSLRRLHYTRS